jgi:metal-responsive CopG/Arc/MetJ family transcriptional regulator
MFFMENALRTTLDLSEKLLNDLMSLEKGASKSAAIEKAIEDYLRRKRLDGLLSMRGRMKTVDHSRELHRMENSRPHAKD